MDAEQVEKIVSGLKDIKPYWLMIEGGVYLNLRHAQSITFRVEGNKKTCTVNFFGVEHEIISHAHDDNASVIIASIEGFLNSFQVL